MESHTPCVGAKKGETKQNPKGKRILEGKLGQKVFKEWGGPIVWCLLRPFTVADVGKKQSAGLLDFVQQVKKPDFVGDQWADDPTQFFDDHAAVLGNDVVQVARFMLPITRTAMDVERWFSVLALIDHPRRRRMGSKYLKAALMIAGNRKLVGKYMSRLLTDMRTLLPRS